jgi:tRNA(Ile)-lysidine synthase
MNPRQPLRRINVARFTQTNRARKARLVSNGFWHIVSIVKEQDLPVMQKGYEQLNEYLKGLADCQQLIAVFHTDAQDAGKSMRGDRIRASRRKHSRKNLMKRKTFKTKKQNSVRYADLARSGFLALERLGVLRSGANNDTDNGAKVGVAVSGGADSVALLRLLIELREELKSKTPFEIAVIHFNHQLRGRSAEADERFVRKLAETQGLKFYCESADVDAAAKRAKRNVEDAGRRERYVFFARLVKEGRVAWVATAHTMDDQAETVLAHVLRGTGLAGLGGIHAISGRVVRPLLGVRRAELRKYLKLRKQSWREDATNRDTTRTRARIREKLIPLLEKKFQTEVVEHLAQLAEHARDDEEFLDRAAEEKLRDFHGDGSAFRVSVDDLVGQNTALALRGRMVRGIVKACKAQAGELGAQHVAIVLLFAERGENGKSLQLPGGVEVRREKDALTFHAMSGARTKAETAIEFEHAVVLRDGAALIRIPLLRRVFRFRQIDWVGERGETSEMRAAVDCSRISGRLVLRNWRPGDRLQPAGRSRVYKLKRLLNAQGVNRWERNGWPVLTNDGAMVWARGFPVSADYAASENTRAALVIDEEPL